MTIFRPFQCIRPRADLASSIAALPYDVYNSAEARAAVEQNPLSFLTVDRAETLLPEGTDLYSLQVYEKAREQLQNMISDGYFKKDENACYYLYELTMDGRSQTGWVGLSSVDDYENQVIRRHENTRADKEQDRILHISTLKAQTGPIFLAYRSHADLNSAMGILKEAPAIYDFTAKDQVRHRVWRITDPHMLRSIEVSFKEIPHTYIADGHHRAASAVRVALNERSTHPAYDGSEEFNYFLSVAFPDDQLRIMDYNRVIKDLNGYTPEDFLDALRPDFTVEDCGTVPVAPAEKQEFGLYTAGRWYRLRKKTPVCSDDPTDQLDVAILQEQILNPLLGIHDPRKDRRIRFVGGIRGLAELQKLVDEQGDGAAFSMYPTSMQELFDVADAGMLMPPKSTWFEPKLRSGLFIHQI